MFFNISPLRRRNANHGVTGTLGDFEVKSQHGVPPLRKSIFSIHPSVFRQAIIARYFCIWRQQVSVHSRNWILTFRGLTRKDISLAALN